MRRDQITSDPADLLHRRAKVGPRCFPSFLLGIYRSDSAQSSCGTTQHQPRDQDPTGEHSQRYAAIFRAGRSNPSQPALVRGMGGTFSRLHSAIASFCYMYDLKYEQK